MTTVDPCPETDKTESSDVVCGFVYHPRGALQSVTCRLPKGQHPHPPKEPMLLPPGFRIKP